MENTSLYYRYWGKAQPDNESGAAYHLLPYHNLDVAAVAYQLLDPLQPQCQRLAQQLKLPAEALRELFSFFTSLHDLGKFARSFQSLQHGLSSDLVPARDNMPYGIRHDELGFQLWQWRLAQSVHADSGVLAGVSPKAAVPWLEIVTGHHGKPPRREDLRHEQAFLPEDIQAADQFVSAAADLLLSAHTIEALADKPLIKRLKTVSWQLAGSAVLADWLGSDQDVFEYVSAPMPLAQYWDNYALPRAARAIQQAGLSAEAIAPYRNIQQLFPFISQPTPLQAYAQTVALNDEPQLFILEDVTGAGKTEAALVLAHRLLAQGQADGLYIALPTMATANAMYQRMAQAYQNLFTETARPSLVLAHGASKLSAQFRASVAVPEQAADAVYARDEHSASVFCNHWLADSRKKALLAQVGVGTLDQALLGVLPVRHQSLRLLGLARKVLLIDEVHAYDIYMQGLLERLLEAHARQGGSVILLSATLPTKMRARLAEAFRRGRQGEPLNVQPGEYPLVTQVGAAHYQETSCATRASVERTVNVERLADEADVLAQIQQAVANNQCVCWVRNTVASARKAYEQLQSVIEPGKLTLFHSRFAMCDRQQIEQAVLDIFGKHQGAEVRAGQVLIATQVVEQSLDLDFDCMISDLAPVDLLIQRAGRLHRHIRDAQGNRLAQGEDQRPAPVLWLHSPDPHHVEDADWLQRHDPGSQAVYRHTGQLWLSARCLLEKGHYQMPQDARSLIEGVYSEQAQEDIPPPLLDASYEALGNDHSRSAMAGFNALDLSKGYSLASASGQWSQDLEISTRLVEQETVRVALAYIRNQSLEPYAQTPGFAWEMSMLNLPVKDWQQASQQISPDVNAWLEDEKLKHKALHWVQVLPLWDGQKYYDPEKGFQPRESGNGC